MACTMSPYLPPHGLLSRRPSTSKSVAAVLERPPVAHLERTGRELAPLPRAVALEAEALVEGVGALVLVERPERGLVVALLHEQLERPLHERAAHTRAPRTRVAVDAEADPAHEALVVERKQLSNAGRRQRLRQARLELLGGRQPEGARQDGNEALVPGGQLQVHHGVDVHLGGLAQLQAQPPAIAGRITIVSCGFTSVSRPSSTRTSSSFR